MTRLRLHILLAPVSLCSALLAASSALAATLSLDAVDQGWYRDDGFHLPSNENTLTGRLSNGSEYRSWYAFDLSETPEGDDTLEAPLTQADAGRITSATVTFAAGNGFAQSRDQSETLALFDVTSDADALHAGTAGVAGFNDLGSGRDYGSIEYDIRGNALRSVNEIVVTLDTDALEDLNSALATGEAQFHVGAVLSTLSSQQRNEYLWAWSQVSPAARLDLEVAPIPLPAGLPLLAGALGGLWLLRRRKQTALAV